jgi:hypothetical protein
MLSLNGITDLGNAHARSIGLINATGNGYDDIKTLITAAGAGAVTSATSPLTIASGVIAIDLSTYATTAAVNTSVNTAINTYATTDAATLTAALNLKQNILVAGASITITGNTISFDNTLYFTATQIAVALTAYATIASVNTLIADYSTTSSLNTALALKQNTLGAGTSITIAGNTISFDNTLYSTTAQMNTLFGTYSTTAQMNTLFGTYSTTAQMNAAITVSQNTLTTAIALKQNTITAGNGIFKNGSTLTSYGLYYNSGNTVATGITELRWDSAYSVIRTVDLSNGVVSLDIGLPTIPDNATISMLNAGLASQNSVLSAGINARQLLINADLNIPGKLTLATTALSSGYGIPEMQFKAGLTNYVALGFTVTASGSNNANEALTITRTGAVSITGSIGNHSDESLKDDVKIVDDEICKYVFNAIDVKTYRRNDYETDKRRIGFIAQDFQKSIPDDFQNIVTESPKDGLLGLDYSRITCILWGVCKSQQKQIDELIAKVG